MLRFLYSSAVICSLLTAHAWGQQLRGPGPWGALQGIVVNEAGEPVAGVSVLGASSHPRSVGLAGTCYDSAEGMKGGLCDGCLGDAANRVVTDAHGRFEIRDLSKSCISVVTVIGRDGTASRAAIAPIDGLVRIVLRRPSRLEALVPHSARILGPDGKPLVGATVTALGSRGTDTRFHVCDPLVEPMALTDSDGRVTFHADAATRQVVVRVKALSTTPSIFELPAGDGGNFRVRVGARISGNFQGSKHGLSETSVWLVPVDPSPERNVGVLDATICCSQEFDFYGVPPERDFYLLCPISDVAERGCGLAPRKVRSPKDGELLDLGTLAPDSVFKVRGRLELPSGTAFPSGFALAFERLLGAERLAVDVAPDGAFEIAGIPSEPVAISVNLPGFRLIPGSPFWDPTEPHRVAGIVVSDFSALRLKLEPGAPPKAAPGARTLPLLR